MLTLGPIKQSSPIVTIASSSTVQLKLAKKRGYDLNLLDDVVSTLSYGLPLDVKPEGDYVYMVDAVIKNPKKKDKRMASHLHN